MFPTLSVTVIGLVVGSVGALLLRRRGWRDLVGGLLGAWLGFAAGALVGVLFDVISGTGIWVAVAGHIGAIAGAGGVVGRLSAKAAVQ